MIRISEIQQFPEFLETFPGNFWTICLCFQIFESFGWMESAPDLFNLSCICKLVPNTWVIRQVMLNECAGGRIVKLYLVYFPLQSQDKNNQSWTEEG